MGYKQTKLLLRKGRSIRGKRGQKGVYDGLIQKITSGIVSTHQKTIPDTPIMSILRIQNYGVARGKKGVKGGKKGFVMV